ncbi:MAG: hypothetical protein PHY34_01825 [Patescibacteria group bacterium]|nr:hypothetical protein [Patescibacteria group bacterium]MDD5715327.1 hypothetical protein [Patescibacteria group bacterium]
MATAWFTLVVGILLCIDGIIFLVFDIEGVALPDWHVGLMILVGVVGIILGLVTVMRKKEPPVKATVKDREAIDEDIMEE